MGLAAVKDPKIRQERHTQPQSQLLPCTHLRSPPNAHSHSLSQSPSHTRSHAPSHTLPYVHPNSHSKTRQQHRGCFSNLCSNKLTIVTWSAIFFAAFVFHLLGHTKLQEPGNHIAKLSDVTVGDEIQGDGTSRQCDSNGIRAQQPAKRGLHQQPRRRSPCKSNGRD
ncbi:hypothetical protein CLOM_g758 [Closterium sp. NIES-68]|nr:hypothetical protein CLOM_g758 [Closterium sp. NIES-68]